MPGGSLGGTMTNCPDLSATARSCTSPSRSSSTVAPGAARPAMTASPVGSIRATSNVGTPSLFSGGGGDPTSASTTAFASACAVASAADSRIGCRLRGRRRRRCSHGVSRRLAAHVLNGEDERHAAATTATRERTHSAHRHGSHDAHPPAGSLARPYFIPSQAGLVLVCARKMQSFRRLTSLQPADAPEPPE